MSSPFFCPRPNGVLKGSRVTAAWASLGLVCICGKCQWAGSQPFDEMKTKVRQGPMKRPLLVGGLFVVTAIIFLWSRHDSVAPPMADAAPAPLPPPMAAKSQKATLQAAAYTTPKVRAQVVTDAYQGTFDSRDIKLAVDEILKVGTADQQGWAVTLVQDCSAVLNDPEFVTNAKNAGDAAATSLRDLTTRCAGFRKASTSELKELRDKLRAGAKESTSDYAKLRALSSRADDGDTRWSTVDEAFIAQSLYADDPVLAYTALEVVISCIDRNIVGADDRSLAHRMVQNRMIEGHRGQVTELMFCASGVLCNASNIPPTDATTPGMLRLEKAYEAALDSKAGPSRLLAIR
jgi:hypothetical protein